ncbi:MAG TPA: hypothetical protein DEA55_09510 [Rhodospirillaceae bacterium]|nr:hypothetical protein [Rhodospirillaceae bacterium]
MALEFLKKTAKKKNKSKREPKPQRSNPVFTAIAITISATFVAMIAMVSMELAILTGGFTAVAYIILLDSTQRRNWENKTDYNISALHNRQEDTAKELARQADEIVNIREKVMNTSQSVNWQNFVAQQNDEPIELTVKAKQSKVNNPVAKKPGPKTARQLFAEEEEAQASAAENEGPDMDTESFPVARPQELVAALTNNFSNDDPYAARTNLTEMVIKDLVQSAVRDGRVDIFVQPIVRLPQRKTRFYEIYARIGAKPGVYLPATRYMQQAREENLGENIDHLLLVHCLKIIKKSENVKKAAPFFINVTQTTLKNTAYMKELLGFLARNRALASRLIFEIPQADFESLSMPVLQIIDGIGKLGCAFSLDHMRQEEPDIALLQKYKIRFVKLDSAWLLREMATDRQFNDMVRMKKKLEANGIGVIAEKIESEHTVKELLDYDINYGQGFLFGKPDLPGAYRRQRAA